MHFLTVITTVFFGWYICIFTVGIAPLQQDNSDIIKWQSHLYASSILGALTVTEGTKSFGVLDKFNGNCGRPTVFAHFPGTKHHYAYKPTYTAPCSLS